MSDAQNPALKKSLDDSDIATEREDESSVSRRSLLGALGVLATGAAGTVLAGCARRVRVYTPAPQGTVYVQQPAQGTVVVQGGRHQTGITDSDGGPYADPAGYGRGPRRQVATGITDGDQGAYADPAGYGRRVYGRSTGITDSDSGPYADPAGNGRGTARLGYTGITDSDGGPYADPAGHGRGRWR